MTKENPKATNTLDLLTKYAVSQRHIPTLIDTSVSRRDFLRGTAITGLTFAMSPWQRALAAHRFPELEIIGGVPPPPMAGGLLKGILLVGEILAGLLGFGSQFQTVYNAVAYFLDGKTARDNAKSALKSVQDEITSKMKEYIDLQLHKLDEKFIDELRKPIKTVFGAGNATTGMLGTRSRRRFLAHAATPPDMRRFYAMTISDTTLNSLIPIFDYDTTNSPYDAKALVGLPTLQSINMMWGRDALVNKYGKDLSPLVYPKSQSVNNRAYGVWEQTYKCSDTYETAQGTTLEFHYDFKGPYKANNADPKTVYGVLTTILGQFPDGNTRRNFRFKDTYCWIPPTTVLEPCVA